MMELNPSHESLTDEEMEFIDQVLLEYGTDDSIFSASELDGFFTAIVSGPEMIMPSTWFPAIWGGPGSDPEWQDEATLQRFVALLMQHMNSCVELLMAGPGQFEPLFLCDMDEEGPSAFIIEPWCAGYMRGVALSDWPDLPPAIQVHLDNIAMHDPVKNPEYAMDVSEAEHKKHMEQVTIAAGELHGYFLRQRTPSADSLTQMNMKKTTLPGRNEPCPCGSGKKFKRCCLH